MMSCGSPFNDSVRPTTARSAPKRRRQTPSLRTTTRPPFGRSSAAVNVRPSATGAPNRRKKSALTWAVAICSGSPSVRLTALKRYAETSWNAPVCLRQMLKRVGDAPGPEPCGDVFVK